MALTTIGFGDDTVDETAWATINGATGCPYAYLGADHWRPYVGGGTRTVQFAQGVTLGWGVQVRTDGSTSISLPAAGAGTAQYMVCLRRTWGSGARTAELVALLMSGAAVVGRRSEPGVVDDQPLCIATVTSGSTTVTQLRDMRVHAAKAHYAPSLEAAGYAGAGLGAQFTLPDGSRYVSSLSPAGTVVLTAEKEPAPPVIPSIPRVRTGVILSTQFNSTGTASVAHNLGYVPAYFAVTYRNTAASILVILNVAYQNAAVSANNALLVAKRSAGGTTAPDSWAPYTGILSQIDWVAVG